MAEMGSFADAIAADGVSLGLVLPPVPTGDVGTLDPVAAGARRIGVACFDLRQSVPDRLPSTLLESLAMDRRFIASGAAREILGGEPEASALVASLRDPDAPRRAAAAWGLAAFRACANGEDALIAALTVERDAGVRHSILASMGECGLPRAREPLCTALTDSHPALRRRAAEALSRFSPAELAPSCLESALSSSDDYVRAFAVWGLARVGPSAAPALTTALRFPEALSRDGAALALLRIPGAAERPDVKAALVALARNALTGGDPARRWQAARLWVRLGESDPALLPAFLRIIDDGGPGRLHAIRAIAALGSDAVAAGPVLRSLADDEDVAIAREAAAALARVRTDPAETTRQK